MKLTWKEGKFGRYYAIDEETQEVQATLSPDSFLSPTIYQDFTTGRSFASLDAAKRFVEKRIEDEQAPSS